MAMRATSGPTVSSRSLRLGETLRVTAKIENKSAEAADVTLAIEDANHPMAFHAVEARVPGKSRKVVAFEWVAVLPDDKPALTYRGRMVLRSAAGDGKVVGDAPLDVYVSRL